MTDKRIKSFLEDRLKRLESIRNEKEWTTAELGDIACCKQTLAFIDSMQEEPVCSVWHDVSKETPIQGSNILMIRKEEGSDFPPIAGCFHGTNSRLDGRNWGYYNGFCYNEIEPPLKWAYVDDLLNLSNVQRTVKNRKEPASEELENAAFDYADACKYYGTEKLLCVEHFKAGANWQKKQFEKNRLEHCDSITEEQYNLEVGFIDSHIDKYNRMPTFLDAIEYGMEKMKEQMMAKAIDGDITFDYYGNDDKIYGCIAHDSFCLEDFGLKDTDKVKVIVIREEV